MPMQKCTHCKHSGANMQKCTSCGKVWCKNCATKGIGNYPKQTAANKCPYCNKLTAVGAGF